MNSTKTYTWYLLTINRRTIVYNIYSISLYYREELWKTLTYFGIPKKYVNMVKLCNNKSECKVKFLGELSSAFEVKTGLRQGDALSPTLFNLGLEKLIREINHSHQVEVVKKEIINMQMTLSF